MSPMKRTALVYDFDGTLAPGNIQEHTFIPGLGVSKEEFWKEVERRAREHDADQILVYMWSMLELSRQQGVPITRQSLAEHGRDTPLFAGLDDWFERIDDYGRERGLDIEHYIVSSGTGEMIGGCSIRHFFKQIYASRFIFDEEGHAVWPGVAINYTTKTQFLFRINKGIESTWDNTTINRWMPTDERPIPFSRMIFLGDGETDIPSMKMVREQGGHSIAVFDPEIWDTPKTQEHVYRLIAEDRAHFTVPADYSASSQLAVTVKGVLGRIARGEGYRGD
ncbi:hypothetical protein BH23GEM6_BH23GEM6_20940 [soil metagenome]